MYKTYSYRVKDSTKGKYLDRQVYPVNQVWNFCNNTQKSAVYRRMRWVSFYDLCNLTKGAYEELGLHSHTVQAVCKQYVTSRKVSKKAKLRYRGRKSLGWIPFDGRSIGYRNGIFKFDKIKYKVWMDRPLPEGSVIKCGSFNRNSKGNWFINVTVELIDTEKQLLPMKEVGIDLGLKDFATLSTGEKISAQKIYRDLEPKLAKLQRAKKKKQVRNLHCKIRNRRKDFHHKLSTRLVKEFGYIVIGNVSSSKLAKTNLAKSIYDAGWYSFKVMLSYKAITHGTYFYEKDEAFTTQTCSSCKSRSGPKGIAGLEVRTWVCSNCNTVLDRDTNSAINILRSV